MRTRARTLSIEMSRRLLHSSRTRVSFDGLIANFLMTLAISKNPLFLNFSRTDNVFEVTLLDEMMNRQSQISRRAFIGEEFRVVFYKVNF